MTPILAITNQKGGCGKTTTAVNLSACLGLQEKRVLLVDLDPQSHATIAISNQEAVESPGLAEVLSGALSGAQAIRPVAEGVDLLPSSWRLDDVTLRLTRESPDPAFLGQALQPLDTTYDFILFDCPPSTGPLTRGALAACDLVLLPVETSYFALYGVGRMLRLIEEEEARRGSSLPYRVLLTLFDRRTSLAREVLKQVREYFNTRLLNSVIAVNVALREAASHGRPITDYRRRSRGCRDYMELCDEVQTIVAGHTLRLEQPGTLAARG
ncbi:MAG: ParA family protein [Acidobacteriota bacterium]